MNRRQLEAMRESKRIEEDKKSALAEINEQKTRLEEDKAEFSAHVAATTRSVEAGLTRLREEEKRFQSMRDDLQKEKLLFEDNRMTSLRELSEVESRYKLLVASSQDIERERNALRITAKDVQTASENLTQRDEELERWEAELRHRETALERRMHEVSYYLQLYPVL